MNQIRTITIPKPLAEKVDKLIDPTIGLYFSDVVKEALEAYLMQVESTKAKNPMLVLEVATKR